MPALKTAIAIAWIPFWIYWLMSATGAKASRPGRRWTPIGGLTAVAVICARVHLGRNWGMPMTERLEPELVTSGPYRSIRHPIYTGLLLGIFGTALATNLIGLVIGVGLSVAFYYAASVEERNMTATLPTAYPAYRASTKMLIPFVI